MGLIFLPYINEEGKEREMPMGFIYKNNISWVSGQYKLISTDNGKNFALYDLIEDEGGKVDIEELMPEQVKIKKSELNIWLASVKKSKKRRGIINK